MEDNTQKNTPNNAPEPSEMDKIKAEAEDVKRQRDEYLNGWKRAKADLLNYQKDEAKRLEEMAKFGTEDLLREITRILDSLNLAFASIEKSGGKVDEGLMLIKKGIMDVLSRRGVEKIEAKPGDEYNPMFHEAIGMKEAAEGEKSGTIAEVIEEGYKLYDYVLKPARVKVVE